MGTTRIVSWWLLLTAGCAAAPASDAQLDDEMAIREAALRYQWEGPEPTGRAPSEYCFVQFAKGKDPPPEFLARFADCGGMVQPGSMGVVEEGGSAIDAVRHRHDGKRGEFYAVTHVRMINTDLAAVEAHNYRGRRASSGWSYRVERRHGRWVVTEGRMWWIS